MFRSFKYLASQRNKLQDKMGSKSMDQIIAVVSFDCLHLFELFNLILFVYQLNLVKGYTAGHMNNDDN